MKSPFYIVLLSLCFLFSSCGYSQSDVKSNKVSDNLNQSVSSKKVLKTEEEWKKILTPEQYRIIRERGTELPFSGKLLDNKQKGKYVCAGCGNILFSSETKYNSGTGWPSFFCPVGNNVATGKDYNLGYARDEILCSRCDAHLGHVFNDGPEPTGLRYCVNSLSLKFEPDSIQKTK